MIEITEKDEQLLMLREDWEDYSAECEAAMRIALAKIVNAHKALIRTEGQSPFDTVEHRLKTFESAVEKCIERGFEEPTIDDVMTQVKDVAGIRVITPFKDDVYDVVNILEHIPGINVVKKKDYVKEPKENGYMSIHLHVQIEVYLPGIGSKLMPVEIQVRDKAMDLWATIEHILKYKNDNPSPEVYRQFKAVAGLLNEFDQMAMDLRDFDPEIAAENTRSALSGLSMPATRLTLVLLKFKFRF